MASKGTGTATFPVKVEDQASGAAKAMSASLEEFRAKIAKSEEAVKEMGGSLRRLRGNSDEVKSAKELLIAKIDAEKNAITSSNLALLKQGTTYDKLASTAKKLAAEKDELKKKNEADGLKAAKERTDALSGAVQKAGGPLAGLAAKFGSLKDTAGSAGGGMALASLAIAGTIALAAKLATTLSDATVSLVKFIYSSANTTRALALNREAAQGSAEQAKNFGTQIDALAKKLPTPKEKLNELAVELARTRLSGNEIVDTFGAVATASSAMGDDVGNTFKDIIKRGQISQHLQINPQELFGTGVEWDDVAQQYAKNTHKTIGIARQELFDGKAKLSDGAKAIKDAVDKRFGSVNAKKMLDLNVLEQKFGEGLANLTKNVKIEPLARGFQTLFSVFDEGTVTGAALQALITKFGNSIGPTFEKAAPVAVGFFKGLAIAGLTTELAFYKVKNALRSSFGDKDVLGDIDATSLAVTGAKVAVYALAGGLVALAAGAAIVAAPFIAAGVAVKNVYTAVDDVTTKLAKTDWSSLGGNLVDGLVAGIKSKLPGLGTVVDAAGEGVKNQFKRTLGINSPSKVFAGYGQNTAEGYAQGVESGAPRAQRATYEMAAAPPALGSGSSGAQGVESGASAPITIYVQIDARGATKEAVQALGEESLWGGLTNVLEKVVRGGSVTVDANVDMGGVPA